MKMTTCYVSALHWEMGISHCAASGRPQKVPLKPLVLQMGHSGPERGRRMPLTPREGQGVSALGPGFAHTVRAAGLELAAVFLPGGYAGAIWAAGLDRANLICSPRWQNPTARTHY